MRTDYEILIEYALKLISRKRYTQKEMEKKLKGKEFAKGDDIEKVIARLKEYKYINDDEYAKDFIDNRVRFSPRGKRLMALELRKKGVSKEKVKKAISDSEINEIDLARQILKRKQSSLKKFSGQKRKEKIFMILASKGFEFDTIYKVADEC
jgi:regulatory protein